MVGRLVLWCLPVVVVVGSFFAAIPWLSQQDDTFVLTLTAALSIVVMGYALIVSRKLNQHLDEVQIAGQGFASSRGWGWGALATCLLLQLSPVADRLIDLANVLRTGSPETSDRGAVRVALVFGLMLVLLMQLLAVNVASLIWQRRMGDLGERS
jgi:hypothetical protein